MIVELFSMSDGARLAEALAIRLRVFVLEQRVPLDEELDGRDGRIDTVHALARDDDGKYVGTARFYVDEPGTAHIGRMAVDSDARSRGVGGAILHRLLAAAKSRRYARAELLAQLTAVGFYERFGFSVTGPVVLDAGIEHVPMARLL